MKILTTMCLLGGVMYASTTAQGAIEYTVTDLGTLGGSYSIAYGMNASGQVTGLSRPFSGPTERAFLYSSGTMIDIGALGGGYSVGQGINAAGQITGFANTAFNAETHVFMYDGTMHDLGTLGGGAGYGYGINDSGLIVGDSSTPTNENHAFLYDSSMHDLGTLGGANSYARAINNSGQITGYSEVDAFGGAHAFLYDGTMHDLGEENTESHGRAINSLGQIAGDYQGRAFLYDGAIHDLGSLGGEDQGSLAWGINDSGQVVGISSISNTEGARAFLYSQASGMVDLNSLIDPLSGWFLGEATAINNAGWIVGNGINPGNEGHAFLLTPVPEPSTFALAALSAFGLIAVRRRLTA